MGEEKCDFWVELDDEFKAESDAGKLAGDDHGVHVQQAGIVSELFRTFDCDRPGRYVDCAKILVRAIEYRAPVMVMQVIIQWCPMTLNYKNRVTGNTIVHLALLHQCSKEIIEVLAPRRSMVLQMVDRDGMTVLHYAAMYRRPLDIVQYLYGLYPELVLYRSTNQQTKTVSFKLQGVCHEAEEETSLHDGAVFRCPGRSTPLCVAVYQDRFDHTLPDYSEVIIFLDFVSRTVKMVPDVSGNTAFMMLLHGKYPESIMKQLLLAFCTTHAEHACLIAFCQDHSRSMMLQYAIKAKLSPECLQIVCDFVIEQFESMNNTMHELSVHGRSDGQEKLGVGVTPGDRCFDAAGVLTSVTGSKIKVYLPIASASEVVHDFAPSDQLLLERVEARRWCNHVSQWVNPTHRDNHRSETVVLSDMIEEIGEWFRGLQQLVADPKLYEPSYILVHRSLQNTIARYYQEMHRERKAVLAAQKQLAQSNGDALIAELEASEKAAEAAKADKSATKSAKNARRRQRMQQQHSEQKSLQQLEAQQREEAHWVQKHTDANARSIDANAAEAGMDIPADPVPSRVRQPSHADLEQARKNIYEQQLLQQLEWECTEQARLAHKMQASPVACSANVVRDDDEDNDFSRVFENAMRMCMPQPLPLPELSEADKVMQDSGWQLNQDRSRRFAEAKKSYEDKMGQELKDAMQHFVDDENGNECMLCSTREIDTFFKPCMHKTYCSACVDSGEFFVFSPENKIKCPLCPAIVDEIIRLQ